MRQRYRIALSGLGSLALAGCGIPALGATAAATAPATPAVAAAPTPVATPPTLQASCQLGWDIYRYSDGSDIFAVTIPAPVKAAEFTSYTWESAYLVTLTNDSDQMMPVSTVNVNFYDSSGNLITTNSPQMSVAGLAPGNTTTSITDSPPDGTATCQVESTGY